MIDHLMILLQDVTARKRADAERERLLAAELEARREAEAASRAKDQFLATLSHELRTPLSPVLTWSELLRRRPASPEDTERGLAAISRNATNLARLIDELLDVSRIESGKLRLEPMPIDLGRVIVEAVDVIHSAAEAKRITIETVSDPAGCRVLGDPDRLRQVLWNLLSNAIKFTSANGTVRITLERRGPHVRVAVTDTGQGIPPAFCPSSSNASGKVDTTSTRQHGGLGIGLAIVRELVELHGGRGRCRKPAKGAARRSRWSYRCWSPTTRSSTPSAAYRRRGARPHARPGRRRRSRFERGRPERARLAGADVRAASSAEEAFTVLGALGARRGRERHRDAG